MTTMASTTKQNKTGVPTNDYGYAVSTYDFDMAVDALNVERWGDCDDFGKGESLFGFSYMKEEERKKKFYMSKTDDYWLQCISSMGNGFKYHPGYKYCWIQNKRAKKVIEKEMNDKKSYETLYDFRCKYSHNFDVLDIEVCDNDGEDEFLIDPLDDMFSECLKTEYTLSELVLCMFRKYKFDLDERRKFARTEWTKFKVDWFIEDFKENFFNIHHISPKVVRDMECEDGKLRLVKLKPRKRYIVRKVETAQIGDFIVGYQTCSNGVSDHTIKLMKLIRSKILGLMWNRTKFNGAIASRMRGNMRVKYVVKDDKVALFDTYDTSVVVEHEMDNLDAHGAGEVSKETSSNIVLTNSEGVSKGEPVPLESLPLWFRWCTSEQVTAYKYLSERFLLVSTVEWSNSNGIGDDLVTYYLPRDAIDGSVSKQKMCTIPNIIPFTIHRYWRGDIEVKVQINSNKFQMGQLQVSWLYATHLDAKVDLRSNVFSLSQTDHGLLNAGSSNECVLYIPYKYYKPFLSTKKRDYETISLVLGRLYIKVLNVLRVPSGGPGSCSVTIFVRYPNSKFVGMIDSSIDSIESVHVEHEMENITDRALKMLDVLFPAKNMDNPPAPRAPMYVVPTASHSWSVGNDISEPLMSLRLGGRGQTPHPFECSKGETNINSMVNKFGLLRIKEWKVENKIGDIICKFEASPLLAPSEYQSKVTEETNLDYYYIPPVGVVSSMFAYWRGTLEFRFDFICTQFHTGRVLCAYVPGVDFYQRDIPMKRAKNSPYVVFDLSESHTFVLRVPYIADKPWWPRRFSGNVPEFEEFAPSSVYMYVLNKLVNMNSISPIIDVNVYMRAGPDFELSVPVQPCLGLGFNPKFIPYSSTEKYALVGYSPYYAGTWFGFMNSKFLIMRYGQTSNQVALFNELDARKYFVKISKKEDGPAAMRPVSRKTKEGKVVTTPELVKIEFGVIFNGGSGKDYYLIPFIDDDGCKRFCREIKAGNGPSKWKTDKMFDAAYGTTGNTYSVGNPAWIVTEVPVSVEHEMENENANNILDPTNDLLTTGNGRLAFGERFGDLKDLCRRYQLYGSKTLNSTSYDNSGRATLSFPALPQGLNLEIQYELNVGGKLEKLDNEIANRCRDGIIPITCSAFKYYRGSLRYRIVLPSTDFVNMWVQHRPDYSCKNNSIQTFQNIVDAATTYNHGYSMYVQNLEVNSIIEFEVPYYMSGMYGILQTPLPLKFNSKAEVNKFYSLGEIVLGLTFGNKKQMENKGMVIQIFYAFGDDMALNTYQGFPPMVFLDDVREKPQPKKKNYVLENEPCCSRWSMSDNSSICELECETVVEHEMMSKVASVINKVIKPTIDELKSESAESISSMSENITSVIQDSVKSATAVVNESVITDSKENFIVSALSEIGHCMINPSIKTFLWSIVSFLLKLGIITYKVLQSTYDLFYNIFYKIFKKLNPDEVDKQSLVDKTEVSSTEQVSEGDATVVQNDGVIEVAFEGPGSLDFEDVSKICTLLMTGVTTLCCVKIDLNKGEKFAPLLLKNVSSGARLFNNLCVLFKNFGCVLRKMFEYVISYIRPEVSLHNTLCEEVPDIKAWAMNVQKICDPTVKTLILSNPEMRQEVEDLYIFGTILVSTLADTSFSGASTVRHLADKISTFRDDLLAGGSSPFVRKEPYCLWISGPPGIGKSTNSTKLVSKMLKHIGYKSNKEIILTVSPTSKYWNNCDHQPCLYVDDMFAVRTNESMEQQLNMMFMVKSNAILNPPMAELQKKNIRYNPEIFLISSNLEFPNINEVSVPSAVYRRRDCLVRMAWAPSYINSKGESISVNASDILNGKVNIKTYPEDVVKDGRHCVYYIARNAIDPQTVWDGPYQGDVFQSFICKDFQKFYHKELQLFQSRVEDTFSLLPASEEVQNFEYDKISTKFAEVMAEISLKIAQRDKATIDYIKDELAFKNTELVDKIKAKWSQLSFSAPKFLTGESKVKFISYIQRKINSVIPCIFKHEIDIVEENATTSSENEPSPEDFADAVYRLCSGDRRVVNILTNNRCLDLREDYSIINTYLASCGGNFSFGGIVKNIHAIYTMFYENYVRVYNLNTLGCLHHMMISNNREITFCPLKKVFRTMRGVEVSQDACVGECIVNNDLLWKLFCEKIIRHSLSGRIYLNRGKYSMLPNCMQQDYYISKNILDKLCQELDYYQLYLRSCYEKYVSPKVRFIVKFFKDHYEKMWWGILAVVGLCYGAIIGKMTYDVFTFDPTMLPKLTLDNEMVNSGDVGGSKGKIVKDFVTERKVLHDIGNAQVNDMCKIMNDNVIYIICKFGNREVKARCLGLVDRAVLILRHYIEECNYLKSKYGENCSFFIQYQPKVNETEKRLIPVSLDDLKIKFFSNCNENNQSNYGVMYLSERCPQFRNIVKYFIPYAKTKNISSKVVLFEVGKTFHSNLLMKRLKVKIESEEHYQPINLVVSYSYPIHGKGMCGSILLDENNTQHPVIGIHVGGANGLGVSEPLYREMFDDLDKRINDVNTVQLLDQISDKAKLSSNIIPLGVIEKTLARHESGVSRIVPSEIHGVFDIRTQPAPLSKNDPRLIEKISPMLAGCDKHGLPSAMFPQDLLIECANDLKDLMISKCIPVRSKVGIVSIEDVVMGNPDIPHFDALNWNTSEGFPFTSIRPKNAENKKWLFNFKGEGSDAKLVGMNKVLVDVMIEKDEQRKNKILPVTIFSDCLKDTRLTLEKIPIPGKTRIFSISPVDFTIQFKQYYLDFIASYMKNRFDLEHMIGMNVDGYEWDLLRKKLIDKGKNILTGDYSNFGPGLNSEVAGACFYIIKEWYKYHGASDIHLRMIDMMAHELIAAKHLCFDFVYSVPCGLPSGSPITTPLNSLVNCLYIRLMWKLIMKDVKDDKLSKPTDRFSGPSKIDSFVKFYEHTTLYTYGDDLIMSVSDDVIEYFNNISLNLMFAKFGIKYTDSTKSEKITKCCSIDEASFLKRKFLKHPWRNLYVSGLEQVSIEDCANWIWARGIDAHEASLVNSSMACDLSFGWGKQYHRFVTNRIKEYWRKLGVHFVCKTYEDLDYERFSDLTSDVPQVGLYQL